MKLIYIIVIFGVCLFAVSCKKEINLKLNDQENKRIVIEGMITDEAKEHVIKLTWTSDFNNPESPQPVKGATVTIDDGTSIDVLTESKPGEYSTKSNYKGVPDKTYKLMIRTGETTLHASCVMNPPMLLDGIATRLDPQLSKDTLWTVLAAFQDRPRKDECFLLKFKQNGQYLQDSLQYYVFWTDLYQNGRYYSDALAQLNIDRGDSLEVEAYSVPREYVDWQASVANSLQMPLPFIGSPPANAFGNVDGGAMGFFLASSVVRNGCKVLNYKRDIAN